MPPVPARLVGCALLVVAVMAAPAAAQERSQRFHGTTREAGLTDGAFLARDEGALGWAAGGTLAGLVAGAFGAVPAVAIAFVARPSIPRDARRAIADQPRVYREAVGEGFSRAVRRKRILYTTVGATVGAVLYYTVIGGIDR